MRSIRPATHRRRFSSSVASAAKMLIRVCATTTPLLNLPEAVHLTTLDKAYTVQRAGWDATRAQFPGTRRIGCKVAATSNMAQASVNMTHPFAGALWSHSTFGYDASCDATLAGAEAFHGAPAAAYFILNGRFLRAFSHPKTGVIWVNLAEKSGHILCNWQWRRRRRRISLHLAAFSSNFQPKTLRDLS